MDFFSQSLKAQLKETLGQSKPWGDVNPLVVIGLTEAILDLNLTEDQMYAAIRSYVRQLAAQIHPDRRPGNVSAERQEQILGAFNWLDDQENFSLALADFKTLKAEDRREIRVVRGENVALRLRIDTYEAQFGQLTADRDALKREKSEYERKKIDEPLLVPRLEDAIKHYHERIGKTDIGDLVAKEVSYWRSRASMLEERVPSLEKRNEETTDQIIRLRGQIDPLKQKIKSQKHLLLEDQKRIRLLERQLMARENRIKKLMLIFKRLAKVIEFLRLNVRSSIKGLGPVDKSIVALSRFLGIAISTKNVE